MESDDRDDPNPASKYAVEMIERMGEAVVVKCTGLDQRLAELS